MRVEEARRIVEGEAKTLDPLEIRVEESLGYVLGEDIAAPIPLPIFDNSAMDGYAIRSEDTLGAKEGNPISFRIIGESRTGNPFLGKVGPFEAVGIGTGAQIPEGADAVIEIEEVEVVGETIRVRNNVERWRNVRMRGEEIAEKDVVLRKGELMTPGKIALLSALGIERISVTRKPDVSIVVTGEEVVPPGIPLPPGRIYDSNTPFLSSSLLEMGIKPRSVRLVGDSEEDIREAIEEAIEGSDLLIITGGVSVGKTDLVKYILEERLGARRLIWRVRQRPGHPFYFATLDGKPVFGLPGNPAAVAVCFYLYLYPFLNKIRGAEGGLREARAILLERFKKKAGLAYFPRVKIEGVGEGLRATPLRWQGSNMIASIAYADGMAYIPEELETVDPGTEVDLFLFPSYFLKAR
jgi:molybdopterin molybdotransferase